jgi:hypothetical protein
MSVIGIYLNDSALSVVGGDLPTSSLPSIVHADPAQSQIMGSSARDTARLTPHLVSTDHWTTLARQGSNMPASARSIVTAELRCRLTGSSTDTALQCAVPAVFDSDALSMLLALMRAEGLNVGGFHDAAALMASVAGLPGTTLVLEMGLGHVSVTRVDADVEVRRRSSATRFGAGFAALQQSWLQRIADAMVLHTRFDPLHDGLSEQRLYDQLESAYSTAAVEGVTEISLQVPTGNLQVRLTRDQFSEAASSTYDEMLAVLHELRPAGAKTNIMLDERMLRLPGLLERIASIRGSKVFVYPTDLAARAAIAERRSVEADGSVSIQRGYAARPATATLTEIDLSSFPAAAYIAPTHILFDGKAFELLQAPFEIGRSPARHGLKISEGLAGVSRLHCSLQTDESGVTLVPHSQQGTWLNDERVRGRVRVSSGDRLRIGVPGVIVELIAVGGADRAAPSQR